MSADQRTLIKLARVGARFFLERSDSPESRSIGWHLLYMDAPDDDCFIQTEGYVGNALVWWRKNGEGYTTDIREAQVFSREEALRIQESNTPGKYRAVLCREVEENKAAQKLTIDSQCVQFTELKTPEAAEAGEA